MAACKPDGRPTGVPMNWFYKMIVCNSIHLQANSWYNLLLMYQRFINDQLQILKHRVITYFFLWELRSSGGIKSLPFLVGLRLCLFPTLDRLSVSGLSQEVDRYLS